MDGIPAHISRHLSGTADLIEQHRHLRGKYAVLVRQSEELRDCLHCLGRYRPRDNLRSRACWMHPGRLIYGHVWSCCDSPSDIIGCVSCMHADTEAVLASIHKDPLNSYLELPAEVLDFKLVPFNANIVEDYPEGSASHERRPGLFYHIRRVAV